MMRRLLLICLFILALPASAQLPVPDPAELSLDWWLFIEGAEENRPQRLAEISARLQAQRDAMREKGNAEGANLAQAVLASLEEYQRWLGAGPRAVKPGPAPQPAYSLNDLYAIADRLPEIELSVAVAAQDGKRLESQIAERRNRLDIERNTYQQLVVTEPTRLQRGMAIMRQRFELESLRLQGRLQKEDAQRLQDVLREQTAEFQRAMELISFDAGDLDRLATEIASLQQQRAASETVLDTADEAMLVSAGLQEEGRQRLAMLTRLRRQISAAGNDFKLALRRAEAKFAGYLVQGSKVPAAGLREQMNSLVQYYDSMRLDSGRWQDYLAGEAMSIERNLRELAEAGQPVPATLRRSEEHLRNARASLRELQRDLGHVSVLRRAVNQQLLRREGWFRNAGTQLQESLMQGWGAFRNWGAYTLFEIEETPVTPAGLLRVVFIIFVAWWISFVIQSALRRIGERAGTLNRASLYALRRVLHYLMLFVGLIIGLSSIGVNFTKFALLAGALGVGIGFGLQNIVQNFIAGLMILFERSLKVGDFVELESGVVGEVREINIRSTQITTNDNIDVLVPNGEFVNGRVTNMTLNEDIMRIRVPFGVAYGSDKERVKRAALKAAGLVPYTLERSDYHPQVFMTQFGDSSLDFVMVVWVTPEAVRMPGKVRSAYLWELHTQLAEAGIEIPFPQRDLHLRSDFRSAGTDPDFIG